MKSHPLLLTLRRLRGNARGCVLTEPLWGIPFNLYAPYASIYMLAFGLDDRQIGFLASVGMVIQVIWTLLSGAITDKLGRKRTTFLFDFLAWSVPTLIWAVAQNYTYFLVAAVVNATWRVTHNSWNCLLVEDTDPDLLVDIYSWVYIAGLLAAFVAPATGLFVGRFGLVPTVRALYLLAFVLMTAKFIILNAMVTETQQGIVRMQETRHEHLLSILQGSGPVLREILHTPATLYIAGLMILLNIASSIRGTFWSILAAEELQISTTSIALYPFVKSIMMLIFFFLVMPRLQQRHAHRPMLLGLAGLIVSQVILILTPPGNYLILFLSTALEGFSVPAAYTMLDALTVSTVNAIERARIMALLNLAVILGSSPFGWIGGELSALNRRLPFVLVTVIFVLSGLLTFLASRAAARRSNNEAISEPSSAG